MTSLNEEQLAMGPGVSTLQTQTITFPMNVNNRNVTKAVTGKDVKIICNTTSEIEHGSSKVRLKNIVDYMWEEKRYPGHLIAVHMDGKHIAYVIKVNNRQTGTEDGMVRVVNTNSSKRALIKGISGEVLDVQFANVERNHVLACIDASNLYVHKIDMLSDNLICNLLLKIEDPLENFECKINKISWCPLFPSRDEELSSSINDEGDQDPSNLIVWSRGKYFQCFNINLIINSHGIGKHNPKDISDGYLKSSDFNNPITWISLSPDGTTLSVGCEDGYIRFYQVYFHEKQPRCLHEWNPHNGLPISSFFFLDNYRKKSSSDTFWKHAMTGANNNTEWKLWDCGTWECLQTITFIYPISSNRQLSTLCFNAEIDPSSSFIVLSNIETRNIYILQIHFESISTNQKANSLDRKKKGTNVSIQGISEYQISWPILSFSIVDTSVTQLYNYNMSESYIIDDVDEFEDDNLAISGTVIRLFVVQPKSVQECLIFYQPVQVLDENYNTEIDGTKIIKKNGDSVSNTISEISYSATLKNKIADENQSRKNINPSPKIVPSLNYIEKSQDENKMELTTNNTHSAFDSQLPSQINLMTPESFSNTKTPANKNLQIENKNTNEIVSSEVLSTILMLASVTGSQATKNHNENFNFSNLVNNKMIEDQQKSRIQSTSSTLQNVFENKQKIFKENERKSCSEYEIDDVDIDEERDDKTNSSENLTSSGSSPPSREVQEIMSSKDYESKILSHFVFKLENKDLKDKEDKFQTASEIAAEVISAAVSSSEKSQTQNVNRNSFSSSDSKLKNNEEIDITNKYKKHTEWAKLSDSKTIEGIESDCSEKSTGLSAGISFIPLSQEDTNKRNILKENQGFTSLTPNKKNSITDLSSKIDTLIEIIQLQTTKINNLETEVFDLKTKFDNNNKYNCSLYQETLKDFEHQILKFLDDFFCKFDKEQKKKQESILFELQKQSLDLNDQTNIKNQLFFSQSIDKFSNAIVPTLLKRLEAIQAQMQAEVAKKLSTLEQALRETITHLCRSKPIIDTFGKSVLMGVQGSLQAAFIESMSSTLIPAYEKSSQNMFRQLHETFSVGIKEVMEQFDNYLSQMQPVQESTDKILNRVSNLREAIYANLSRQGQFSSDNLLEMKKELKQMEINFLRHFSEIIKKEIRKSFETQVASLEDSVLSAVRSQAATPAPSVLFDIQDQIKQLLSQNQINSAFNQALLANDLSLVEYTLDKVDYKLVFTNQGCCLEQTVLLSLIQQISTDMSNHNDLKQKYLSDAILNLNLNDPITKEHAPKVMNELYRNCQNYLVSNPKGPLCSNIRMIMMAVMGMGYKFN